MEEISLNNISNKFVMEEIQIYNNNISNKFVMEEIPLITFLTNL